MCCTTGVLIVSQHQVRSLPFTMFLQSVLVNHCERVYELEARPAAEMCWFVVVQAEFICM